MLAKWFDEYSKFFRKTKLISKLGTFSVALFAFLSCCQIFRAVSYDLNLLNNIWNKFIIAVIFHFIIGALFTARFTLLFFNSKKDYHLTQIFWLICILATFGYYTATQFAKYGSFFRPEVDTFGLDDYPTIFLYASNSFEGLLFVYFFAGLFRQIITFTVAVIKSR